jgi:hypothetical protein
MKIEPFRQKAGVTEKYVPGAGATPVQWTCRVGCAALVAPAPRHSRYPENICRRYRIDP